ncbi:Fic family protein [Rickettsia australis]|nr:Fic family protein [Rickettsia australis]
MILKLHNYMLVHSEKDARHKGNYKFGSNHVEAKDHNGNVVGTIFDSIPPYLVKNEIQELIDWYNWTVDIKTKHPLIIIANFIFEYLAIHSFQDRNGRTSRLLTNLLLLKHSYLFLMNTLLKQIKLIITWHLIKLKLHGRQNQKILPLG